MVLSESILKRGRLVLDGVSIRGLNISELPAHPNLRIYRPFYQLVKINGHVLYSYPFGSSVLSLPLVALLNAGGLSTIDRKGDYNYLAEVWIQKIISSLLMAGATCLFLASAYQFLPLKVSLAVALGAAFGTQIWSSATRALWSHTWEVFLGAYLILMLIRREQGLGRRYGPLFATIVSWMFFVRPTGAIIVVAIGAYLLSSNRSEFLCFAVTGFLWLLSFVIFSRLVFGEFLPDYYRLGSSMHLKGWFLRFAGCLISPSRGLLIFTPAIWLVIYLVGRHWKMLRAKRLAVVAISIISAQIIMVASWPNWWGGYSFGPRLFTDVIPWFVLLAILGLRAQRDSVSYRIGGRNVEPMPLTVVALLLTVISVAINGYGAFSWETRLWNERVNIDSHPERVWNWRSSQLLAGLNKKSDPVPK